MELREKTIVFFCMPEPGHFSALRAIIACVVRAGAAVVVYTHQDFQQEIERLGGRFVDLFASFPLPDADDESQPIPCRYVSFAGYFAEPLAAEVRHLRPALIIYDSFAVAGRVVARRLGIPFVCVSVGHNINPERYLAYLKVDPRVAVSNKCHAAVTRLRECGDLDDPSPFSYVTSLSPHLNLYCEPPEFLESADRKAFAPVAFFGCVSKRQLPELSKKSAFEFGRAHSATLKIYVAFGTIVWRYFARQAATVLAAIADACVPLQQVRVVASLGGADVDPCLVTQLANENVRVLRHVDQDRVLREADVFVTHHGVNSTHEAIFHRVPMISYPFFWDQPALAYKCQQFGVALPLTNVPCGMVNVEDVRQVLMGFAERRPALQANLETAHGWETRVMQQRDAVMRRLAELLQLTSQQLLR